MNKKKSLFFIIPIVLIVGIAFIFKFKPKANTDDLIKEVSPAYGNIQQIISTTGTVLPKNRLEIKPPVNGRLEKILVKEGDIVKPGQILVWMSSTERAALLDASRSDSEEKLKYWQEVYKPISLMSPIEAEVIVATAQAGQTITANDAVIVLSDQLIVRAQVDETDIGKVKTGQNASISMDAYPDIKIKADVDHIYYESKTVNNVTMYEVDLIPEKNAPFMRSGMNASIDFVVNSKDKVLLLPEEAVQSGKDGKFVLVREYSGNEPEKRKVETGISDEKNIEIISGLDINEKVVLKSKKYVLPKSDTGTNPFMPARRKNSSSR